MNGFNVHAVGWLVTRDLCCEATSALFGLKHAINRQSTDELLQQWQRLLDAVDEDVAGLRFETRLLGARRVPLSKRSEAAMRTFFDRLLASYPERYNRRALRGRCMIGSVQTIASFTCCLILGHYATPDIPTLGQAGFAFLLVGIWYFATTVQLFRTYRLVRVLADTPLPKYEQRAKRIPGESKAAGRAPQASDSSSDGG